MKSSLLIALAILTGTFGSMTRYQDPEPIQEDTSEFMQRKLDYSREIVEGLSMEDFDQIAKAAQDMMLLSQEADWNVATTPEYLKASSDFRETVSRLGESAKQQNLDGSTLAYFEITLNCVRCHKQLRQSP